MFQKIVTRLKGWFGAPAVAVPEPPKAPAKGPAGPPPRGQKKPLPEKRGEHHPRDIRHTRHRDQQPRGRRPAPPPAEGHPAVVPAEPWDAAVFKVPVVDGKSRFHDADIPAEIMHAIHDLSFQYMTPVQAEVLPKALAGEDITAQAQTGTGKTAAFLITILTHILRNPLPDKRDRGTPRALILAPTRELVMQIEKDARALAKYVPCSIISLVGGIDYQKQMDRLKHEAIDIVAATPGRLIDFKKQKVVELGKVEILIIDEADRMLDMGFIPAVRYIVLSTPQKSKRQTMFFSATMTSEVRRLSESWTKQAHQVSVMPDEVASKNVEQIVYIATKEEKFTLFCNLLQQKQMDRVLVFVNRKDVARDLRERLEAYGITCTLLSGDVDQPQRIKRLENFRNGKVRVLVATDVASRGIHVDAISHVVNYNLPQDAEEYVHRIGRTGRAGAMGTSISFADEEDSYEIPKIEEFLGHKLECVYPDEHLLIPITEVYPRREMKHGRGDRGDRGGSRRRRSRRPPRRPG